MMFAVAKRRSVVAGLLLALGIGASTATAQVIQYPKPSIYEDSKVFSLKINGQTVPVIGYSGDYDYAVAGLKGSNCEIEVTRLDGKPIRKAAVSPWKQKIKTAVAGSKVKFRVDGAQYLIVDIEGMRRLAIAIDPPEADAPAASGPGIFNITDPQYGAKAASENSTLAIQKAIDAAAQHPDKPGIVYVPAGVFQIRQLQLPSDVSLYLAPGSVLRASGEADELRRDFRKDSVRKDGYFLISTVPNARNIKVFGRGTIDGNGRHYEKKVRLLNHLLVPMACQGFTLDGPILRESALWGFVIANSRDVAVRNSKHFNRLDMGEDDCIDICNSQNVTVQRSIAISLDDPYSTKTWDHNTDIAKKWAGNFEGNSNILIEDCLAWTRCFSFKIGAGVWKNQENITVRNSTSFDAAHAIGISHSYGSGDVRNVTFENIDVERTTCDVLGRSWARIIIDNKKVDSTAGEIHDIVVRDFRVYDPGTMPVPVQGLNDRRQVHGVTFKNIQMQENTPATDLAAIGVTQSKLANGVVITP